MKTPSLEEVKEYFKDAELVKNRFGKEFETCEIVHGHCPNSFMNINKNDYNSDGATVWDEKEGYAKILTYKEPKEETFVITKEQIETLVDVSKNAEIRLKDWFPSAFVEDKKELVLEVGKWYKNPNIGSLAYCKEILDKNSFYGHGFGSNNCGNEWFDMSDVEFTCNNWTEATPEEVKETLTKEAVKRGFVEGAWISWRTEGIGQINGKMYWAEDCLAIPCNSKTTKRDNNNFPLFHEGIWAEIIPTLTKAEAEQKLNCKII